MINSYHLGLKAAGTEEKFTTALTGLVALTTKEGLKNDNYNRSFVEFVERYLTLDICNPKLLIGKCEKIEQALNEVAPVNGAWQILRVNQLKLIAAGKALSAQIQLIDEYLEKPEEIGIDDLSDIRGKYKNYENAYNGFVNIARSNSSCFVDENACKECLDKEKLSFNMLKSGFDNCINKLEERQKAGEEILYRITPITVNDKGKKRKRDSGKHSRLAIKIMKKNTWRTPKNDYMSRTNKRGALSSNVAYGNEDRNSYLPSPSQNFISEPGPSCSSSNPSTTQNKFPTLELYFLANEPEQCIDLSSYINSDESSQTQHPGLLNGGCQQPMEKKGVSNLSESFSGLATSSSAREIEIIDLTQDKNEGINLTKVGWTKDNFIDHFSLLKRMWSNENHLSPGDFKTIFNHFLEYMENLQPTQENRDFIIKYLQLSDLQGKFYHYSNKGKYQHAFMRRVIEEFNLKLEIEMCPDSQALDTLKKTELKKMEARCSHVVNEAKKEAQDIGEEMCNELKLYKGSSINKLKALIRTRSEALRQNYPENLLAQTQHQMEGDYSVSRQEDRNLHSNSCLLNSQEEAGCSYQGQPSIHALCEAPTGSFQSFDVGLSSPVSCSSLPQGLTNCSSPQQQESRPLSSGSSEELCDEIIDVETVEPEAEALDLTMSKPSFFQQGERNRGSSSGHKGSGNAERFTSQPSCSSWR